MDHPNIETFGGVGGGGLKRSQRSEFALSREKSFVRNNKDNHKRKSYNNNNNSNNNTSNNNNNNKGKPAMELYRPPNVRTEHHQRMLNVHAKEFTMIRGSKSSANLYNNINSNLQHSSSSGNILKHHSHHQQQHQHHHHHNINNLNSQFVPFILPATLINPNYYASPLQSFNQRGIAAGYGNQKQNNNNNNNNNLKRSKSLGAADYKNNIIENMKNFVKEETSLGTFPLEDQENLNKAIENPNQLPSRTLMNLVKVILEKVVQGIEYAEAGANTCASIIEKEKTHTFLESLLNMCQQWYQERDQILRGIKAGDGTRFTAFMWFLTAMCGQMRRRQFQTKNENLQPDLTLLNILTKCCQACVSLPIVCLQEMECLFFVLTSIGRDLETELPEQLEQLLATVRDAFLASVGSPTVRKTLLQLIELHASNWLLPGSSVLYYYPRIK